MNRIEESFSGDVEVLRLNANQNVGRDAFRSYRMQGHPAFVLLNPQGEVLWTGLGVQSIETIETEIEIKLITPY